MMKSGITRRGRRGFTLVELLLVLMILATLAAIVIPKFSGRKEQADRTAAKTQIATISTALDMFEQDMGFYPKTADGLDLLFNEPRTGRPGQWKGPYMKTMIPNDPWGNPYIYECPGRHDASGYDLSSAGADGQRDTQDDIVSWDMSKE